MGLPLKIIKRTFGTSDWQLAREATPFPARLQLGHRGQQSSIHGLPLGRKIDPAAGLPKSPIHPLGTGPNSGSLQRPTGTAKVKEIDPTAFVDYHKQFRVVGGERNF
jgi:hypothetical protein